MEPPSSVIIAFIAVVSLLVARGTTYSTGAPPEGCWSDRPLHGDHLPQGGPVLPYKIIVSANAYGPRDTIRVSVVGSDETSPMAHRGFLLRMVSSASQRGGLWAVDRTVHRYNPECGVTHRDARTKTNTTILWRAPAEHKGHLGNIQFRAVVAANFTHFWDNIVSDTLAPNYPARGDTGMMRRFQQIFSILNDNTGGSRLPPPKRPASKNDITGGSPPLLPAKRPESKSTPGRDAQQGNGTSATS